MFRESGPYGTFWRVGPRCSDISAAGSDPSPANRHSRVKIPNFIAGSCCLTVEPRVPACKENRQEAGHQGRMPWRNGGGTCSHSGAGFERGSLTMTARRSIRRMAMRRRKKERETPGIPAIMQTGNRAGAGQEKLAAGQKGNQFLPMILERAVRPLQTTSCRAPHLLSLRASYCLCDRGHGKSIPFDFINGQRKFSWAAGTDGAPSGGPAQARWGRSPPGILENRRTAGDDMIRRLVKSGGPGSCPV